MKHVTIFATLFTLLLFQACNQTGDSNDPDEVAKLLTQYSIEWAEAIKNKDGSSVEQLFSPDMIYQNADGTLESKDELIRGMNEFTYEMLSFSIQDINVKLVGSDIAIVTGGGGQAWIDQDGEEQQTKSRFTNVWKKQSGNWLCIAGHGNPLIYGDIASDLAKIKAIPEKATEAINSGDFIAWLELFDDSAQVMLSGMKTLKGKEEMMAGLGKYWEDPESDYSIVHYETRMLGDFAYGIGTVEGTEKNPDTGKIEVVNSRELVVFKKQGDGEWKTFRLLVNQNQ